MAAPLFYHPDLQPGIIQLDEDTSKHMIGVLRMTRGGEIKLTDGKGLRVLARISDENRKKASVQVISRQQDQERAHKVTVAISLVKNSARFEWFLEKATEMGVHAIIPLICERTEREKFRHDRMHSIIVSAMLQSEQSWLPLLHEPLNFKDFLKLSFTRRFIAHCLPESKTSLRHYLDLPSSDSDAETHTVIAIGPEGDFTPEEVSAALAQQFIPVALGDTRLRTETAGMVATALLVVS
jgi:16S rRNA (uracil1498-N3)-methyltransferase